jgi:AcrR family transcriptional regulator
MLNMRSADDLTTRARIRDAAITRFAREGFRVPVRVIAKDAGVSPALVIHHFGSKDGLRAACDEHVLQQRLMLEDGIFQDPDGELIRATFGNLRAFDEPVAYLLRAVLEGGETARAIIDRTARVTEKYLESGVAAGVVRPCADPAARARYLTYMSLGMLVTAWTAAKPSDDADPYANVSAVLSELMLPHLDLMTHGLIVNPALLETMIPTTSQEEQR